MCEGYSSDRGAVGAQCAKCIENISLLGAQHAECACVGWNTHILFDTRRGGNFLSEILLLQL
jgi:hypothetical protein